MLPFVELDDLPRGQASTRVGASALPALAFSWILQQNGQTAQQAVRGSPGAPSRLEANATVAKEGFSMQAATFWRTVTRDYSGLLKHALQILEEAGARYCVIGGQAINAYAEPVVSLDLGLALAPGEIERLRALFGPPIRIERFEHSGNLSAPDSDLRIQFQVDPRYDEFPARAEVRDVLGHRLPVARLEDVLRGKVWAASDSSRRASKRQKDLADISRLLEGHPELREMVPEAILQRLVE